MNDTFGAEVGRTVPAIEGIVDLVPIGRGGFGTVFRGYQADINRTVAIKVLNGPAHDREADRRFRREVTAMGAISHHPNVVPVYAIGVAADGRPFLVMPYLPGGTLKDRLGTLTWQQMVDLGSKMSGALQAAHDVGVLHRDVKPANILWSAWDEPQLGDFGIARLHDATRTAPGLVVASLTWAAPEVLEGKPASPASDVYSLAASLHAAITGRSPYAPGPDEPMATTVARIAAQPPPDLVVLGVPHAVNDVIAAGLAKDPTDRPVSARAFGDALVATVAEQPVRGRQPTRVPVVEPVAAADPDTVANAPAGVAPRPLAAADVGRRHTADEQPTLVDDTTGGAHHEPVAARGGAALRPNRRPRRATVAAGLAGCVVLLLLALLGRQLLTGRDDSSGSSRARAAARSTAPGTVASTAAPAPGTSASLPGATRKPSTSVTAPEAHSRPSSTTSGPTTSSTTTQTTSAVAGPGQGAAQVSGALTNYYRLVSQGAYDLTWPQLTPAYQHRTGGFARYTGFWKNYTRVDLSNVRVDGDLTATATLRYRQTNGGVVEERGRFRFVRLPSGALAIDSYRVSSRIA